MFVTYEVTRSLLRALAPLLRKIAESDKDLARQGQRAASSILLNVAEANGRRKGDRTHLFSVARGSAQEIRAVLHASLDLGYLREVETTEALGLAERTIRLLWGLAPGRR